jgi:hypothetical protein
MEYPGRVLRQGDMGPAVEAVQRRLGVQPTAIFGPTTREAIRQFQATHRDAHGRLLAVDGGVGPFTWAALFAESRTGQDAEPATPLGGLALQVALSQVGVREQPPGSNRGPAVDQYNRAAGCPVGSYWCMAFVWWCHRDAAARLGVPNPLPRTGRCSTLYRWAKREGHMARHPRPGDIFLVRGGRTGHCHTGLVVAVPGERVQTVEGNTDPGGSANGIGVFQRSRPCAALDFVRLPPREQ